MRLFEIASASLGLVAFTDGALLAVTGRWAWPWKWFVSKKPGASARLYGVTLIILGVGLVIAPIFYENRAWGSPYLELIPTALALAMMIVFFLAIRHRSAM